MIMFEQLCVYDIVRFWCVNCNLGLVYDGVGCHWPSAIPIGQLVAHDVGVGAVAHSCLHWLGMMLRIAKKCVIC